MLGIVFNSLGLSDATWGQRTESTLAQVMACCLMAPNYCLKQCPLIISKCLWHPSEGITLRKSEGTNQWNNIENCIFKMHSDLPGANDLRMAEFFESVSVLYQKQHKIIDWKLFNVELIEGSGICNNNLINLQSNTHCRYQDRGTDKLITYPLMSLLTN